MNTLLRTLSRSFVFLLLGASAPASASQNTPTTKGTKHLTDFEKSKGLKTVHPTRTMLFYRQLAAKDPRVHIEQIGTGDAGHPIHVVIVSKSKRFTPKQIGQHAVILVNNGIHSGESCGIDATQLMVRELLQDMEKGHTYDNLIFVTIPVLNVGGQRQFRRYNRANQNGPVRMGFRGNARNYDLNRDFIKADTQNILAFTKLFHRWKPHIFVDNHSTNGADYQHTMTYTLPEGPDLSPSMRALIKTQLKPFVEKDMAKKGLPLCPYVTPVKYQDLKKGLKGWIYSGRFSTGYVKFFHTIPVLSETHMLKSYKKRVRASFELMKTLAQYASKHARLLHQTKQKATQEAMQQTRYTLRWKRTKASKKITFLGSAYYKEKSSLTGGLLTRYDRSKPQTWTIPFYNSFAPKHQIDIPHAYLIPPAWKGVLKRLRHNKIKMTKVEKTHTLTVRQSIFTKAAWSKRPYEGHFYPTTLQTESFTRRVVIEKGTWIVPTKQPGRRYIIETLEPTARDAFVRWGFFNTLFQQKEYFSPYTFEGIAKKLLKRDKRLREIFENRLRKEPDFASSPRKRLQFIYQSSPYYEKPHNTYPIVRWFKK